MNSTVRFTLRRLHMLVAGTFALSFSSVFSAPFGLGDAWSVHESLGPRTAAEVLRIEHRVGGAARVSFATVFEFSGLLWLYRPERGTESIGAASSLSTEPSREALVVAFFAPGGEGRPASVRAIEAAERSTGFPRNGCVPESIALLRRLAAEQPVEEARLLFYYYREVIPGTVLYLPQAGHTVLVARVGRVWRAYDVMANRETGLGRSLGAATVSARSVERSRAREILSARYLVVPAAEFATVRF